MKLPGVVLDIAPHSMEMDGMSHHRVIHQHDPHALAIFEDKGICIRKLRSIKGPRELLHMTRQMKFECPLWLAAIGIREQAPEILISQNLSPVISQSDTRIIQACRWSHRLRIHEWVPFLAE